MKTARCPTKWKAEVKNMPEHIYVYIIIYNYTLSTTHPCAHNSYGTGHLAMSTWHSGSTGLGPEATTGLNPTGKRRALQQQRQQAALNLFMVAAP